MAQNGGFGEQNSGKGGAMFIPTNLFLLLGVVTSVPLWQKWSRNATVRMHTN